MAKEFLQPRTFRYRRSSYQFISNTNNSRGRFGLYSNQHNTNPLGPLVENMIGSEKTTPIKKTKIINTNFFKLEMKHPFKELHKRIKLQIKKQQVIPQYIQQIIKKTSSVLRTEREFFYRLIAIKKYDDLWTQFHQIIQQSIQGVNKSKKADKEKFEKITSIIRKIHNYLQIIHRSNRNIINQQAFKQCFPNTWQKEFKWYKLNLNKQRAQEEKRKEKSASKMNQQLQL